jgi:hypothetical protein
MNTRRRLVIATAPLLVLIVAGSAAWLRWRMPRPVAVALRFHAAVGAEPLVLNQARYANPGGAGRFAVRDFQFFLSNIRLVGPDGVWSEPDSYHLLRFDGAAPLAVLELPSVPRARYTRIEFGIGVDPPANRSVAMRGDLDPNGRMAWTWDVGYKFVLFEGTLETDGARRPLVYHVGFDENYATLAFPLAAERFAERSPTLDYRVDLLQMFRAGSTIDMAALPSVKFDREEAARLAANYGTMITPL